MKSIDPGDLSGSDLYQLLISAVVPRPIALVSTVSPSGLTNLSPFSFFNAVASRPPLVMISLARSKGSDKHTMRNIRDGREFVVNVVTRAIAEPMVKSSADWCDATSEFEAVGLTPLPSDKVAPPRVAESPVHMECVAVEMIDEPAGSDVTLVLGRILRFHVARALLDGGRIDPRALDPLARLGGDLYAGLGEPFSLRRPAIPETPARP